MFTINLTKVRNSWQKCQLCIAGNLGKLECNKCSLSTSLSHCGENGFLSKIIKILSITTRVWVGYHFYFTRDVSSKLFPECFSTRGIIFKKHPKWNKSDTTWEKSCGKDFILWLIFEVDLDLHDSFFFALFMEVNNYLVIHLCEAGRWITI